MSATSESLSQPASLSPLADVHAGKGDSVRGSGALAYSCVLDKDPSLEAQTFIWVNCLLEIQAVPPENVFVHYAGIANASFAQWLRSLGINLVPIETFDPRSPHCNKLQQIKTFLNSRFDRVALMDCDTAWIGPQALPKSGPVLARIVALSRPAETVLRGIFRAAGFGEPDWVPVLFPREPGAQRSDRNNLNGGLYFLSVGLLSRLDVSWRRWAKWCLDHRELFGDFGVNVDQVSFALAMRELGLSADHLPMEWNYPVHPGVFTAAQLPDVAPQILHFHRNFDEHLRIASIGVPKPDQAIESLNQRIAGLLERYFVKSEFWGHRYRIDPASGHLGTPPKI